MPIERGRSPGAERRVDECSQRDDRHDGRKYSRAILSRPGNQQAEEGRASDALERWERARRLWVTREDAYVWLEAAGVRALTAEVLARCVRIPGFLRLVARLGCPDCPVWFPSTRGLHGLRGASNASDHCARGKAWSMPSQGEG